MIQPTIVNRDVTLHIIKSFDLHISKKLGLNFLIKKNKQKLSMKSALLKTGWIVINI